MYNETVKWAKKQLNKGFKESQVRKTLKEAGYNKKKIDEAIKKAQGKNTSEKADKNIERKKELEEEKKIDKEIKPKEKEEKEKDSGKKKLLIIAAAVIIILLIIGVIAAAVILVLFSLTNARRIAPSPTQRSIQIMAREMGSVSAGGICSVSTNMVGFTGRTEIRSDIVADKAGMKKGSVKFCCSTGVSDDCEGYVFPEEGFDCDEDVLKTNQDVHGRVRACCPITQGEPCTIGFKP